MTVATTANKITYQGNGSTTSFSFAFAFPAGLTASQASQLLSVVVVDPTGASTPINFGPGVTQYQLNILPPVAPNPTSVGGIVTYAPGGSPLAIGNFLTITRLLPDVQPTSLQAQGTLYQPVVEQMFDYLTMLSQQLINAAGLAVVAPPTDPAGLNYTLPAAGARANSALVFDSQGNVATGVLPTSGVISAPMQPVVAAASLAAGRTAFGLGTMATMGIGGGLANDGSNNARVTFGVNKVSVPTTVLVGNYLQKFKVLGPTTITLSRASTNYFSGFGFWIEVLPQSTGPVTIAIDPADQFENLASGASVVAAVGASAFINTDAATNAIWYLELSRGAQATAPPVGSYSGGLSVDVTSNTTATCSVGQVVVSDGQNYFTTTPSGGINTATIGAGGLDVGPLTTNTFYNLWVIYGVLSGTSTWIISLASTFAALKPNLPATYSAGARLGKLKTQSASTNLVGTQQRGAKIQYVVGAQLTGLPSIIQGVVGNPVTPTWVSESTTGIIPSDAKSWRGALWLNTTSIAGIQNCAAAPNGNHGAVGSTTNPPPVQLSQGLTAGAGQANNGPVSIPFEFTGGGPVFYASNFAASGIYALGWEENL